MHKTPLVLVLNFCTKRCVLYTSGYGRSTSNEVVTNAERDNTVASHIESIVTQDEW